MNQKLRGNPINQEFHATEGRICSEHTAICEVGSGRGVGAMGRAEVGMLLLRVQASDFVGSAPPGDKSWRRMYFTRSELLFKRIFSKIRLL